ncbi:MAG: hypothetical protein J0I24_09385 [Thiomonas arsenitoxydans]|uniref:Uncharacterized protein n=1 Tax=Thiomonas arsenitoxydans (strain DSM 22701 / CIP 110005 / 3As) TaxID=426114 RepID=A0A8I1MVH9_THIA3|nr:MULTISPECIES: hypothetical protein [Thiomonas]MBN8744506.1 hypothetical protein [Thiomonas arsenitoxydans]ODU97004.1 MAG: hypothetical protein ABT24_06885 [Thiomonas sp. SCN 64-16]
MQTQTKNQKNATPARGGRPAGSLARIPVGHVDIKGLGERLGLSPASIPAMERRGDPIIPPRSPLAGFGQKRRAIWRSADVDAHIEALAAARPARPAPVEPVTSAWPISQLQPAPAPAAATSGQRRPGRPRGKGNSSKYK